MTDHQASRAEHQGTPGGGMEARCHIYNCLEEATHIVDLPASTNERLSPSARRAATVRLCPPCHSDWLKHPNPERLRSNIDLVRARPPQGGGMAQLERDVIAVPRDTKVKRLVEDMRDRLTRLLFEASVTQGELERLAVLLDERDAAAGDLRESLTWALEELQMAHGAVWEKNDWEHYQPVIDARARVKGGAS